MSGKACGILCSQTASCQLCLVDQEWRQHILNILIQFGAVYILSKYAQEQMVLKGKERVWRRGRGTPQWHPVTGFTR